MYRNLFLVVAVLVPVLAAAEGNLGKSQSKPQGNHQGYGNYSPANGVGKGHFSSANGVGKGHFSHGKGKGYGHHHHHKVPEIDGGSLPIALVLLGGLLTLMRKKPKK